MRAEEQYCHVECFMIHRQKVESVTAYMESVFKLTLPSSFSWHHYYARGDSVK